MRNATRSSRSFVLCFAAALIFSFGCSPSTAPMSDATIARELLQSMLEQWKAGEGMSELKKRDPPVYMAEDLWKNNSKLEDYAIEGESEVLGSNIRFQVKLKCNNRTGKVVEKSVRYLVTTKPALTIVREEG